MVVGGAGQSPVPCVDLGRLCPSLFPVNKPSYKIPMEARVV